MISQRLRSYIFGHRWEYLKGFALGVVATGVALIAPSVLRRAVDGIRGGISSQALLGLAATYVALALGGPALPLFLGADGTRAPPPPPHRVRDAQRLLRPPAASPSGLLPAHPHGRSDGAGDQRPERGAAVGRAGHHVRHQHAGDAPARRRLDDPAGRAAGPLGGRDHAADRRDVLPARPADPPPLRTGAGTVQHHLRPGAGELLWDPGGQGVRPGTPRDRRLRPAGPGVHPP